MALNKKPTPASLIDVACAIIVDLKGRVLVTQRSSTMKLPLKMEFPGGKVEVNELPAECLLREIKEELNLEIRIISEMPAIAHFYPSFGIRLIPFVCEVTGGTIELREHAGCWWMEAKMLTGLDWAEADVAVVKNYLNSI
jgi:8-oxo-dGTP diphosphatase